MEKLQFHPLAEIEAEEISSYYEEISLSLANRFITELASGLNRISNMPLAYPLVSQRVRKMVLLVFPYSILFSTFQNRTYIIAIAHHSRRPGYWQARIKDILE